MTLSQALADKLRRLLREREWTQIDLAARLGYSESATSYLLHAKRRGESLDLYQRIADLCGQRLGELFTELEARAGKQQLPTPPPGVRPEPPPLGARSPHVFVSCRSGKSVLVTQVLLNFSWKQNLRGDRADDAGRDAPAH